MPRYEADLAVSMVSFVSSQIIPTIIVYQFETIPSSPLKLQAHKSPVCNYNGCRSVTDKCENYSSRTQCRMLAWYKSFKLNTELALLVRTENTRSSERRPPFFLQLNRVDQIYICYGLTRTLPIQSSMSYASYVCEFSN
jgi:hypothetical protein